MMDATFRFYADLNDFLPPWRRQVDFGVPTGSGDQSVKHLIEAGGVPHTEVGLILVNGRAVSFSVLIQPGDRVSVYPIMRTLAPDVALRPPPPDPARFLLDNHLGKLARLLRLLGFDTAYFRNQFDDAQLAQLAADEDRILLTRDRGLLKRSVVVHGYCLRTTDSASQATAVLQRYGLHDQIRPWTRCLRCNGLLLEVEKAAVIDRLEPKTKLYFESFRECQSCRQVYWRGSHFDALAAFVARAAVPDTSGDGP